MKQTIVIVLIMATLIGCQKEIFIPQPPYQSTVSIQGVMEPDSVPMVYFNRTVPYMTGSINTADLVIRNAVVNISSPEETDVLALDSILNKVDCRYDYFYRGSQPAQANTPYTLTITDGAKTYSATTNTTLTKVSIDSVIYTPAFNDLYGEHEGVITYFNDIPNEDDYYRYEMVREVDSTVRRGEKKLYGSCLGNEHIMYRELGRSVFSDGNLTGQQINIVVEPAWSHAPDTVAGTFVSGLVRIQTLDRATYEFYEQTDQQKLGVNNPFVEPTFLVNGQFGNDAFGFFGSRVRSEPVPFTFPE